MIHYKILLFLIAFLCLSQFCEYQTHGFRYHQICSDITSHPRWEVPSSFSPPQEKLNSLLSQTFHYYAKGDQSYVFLGEDQKTILKFFKHDHLSIVKLLKNLFPYAIIKHYASWIWKHKDRNLIPVFDSAKIALEQLKAETGLIYLHLNKTENFLPTIKIKDPLGIVHTVLLDRTEFILQEKASLLFPEIKKQLIKGNTAETKDLIRKLFQSIALRCDKGIRNVDHSSHRNMGLIDDSIVEFDIGSYVYDLSVIEETGKKIELLGHTKRIKRWIKKYSPDLLTFYESQIHYWAISTMIHPIFIRDPEKDQGPLSQSSP